MKLVINNIEIDTDYYVKKWVDLALEATPATDEQVISNIKKLYSKAGLKKPQKVIKIVSGILKSLRFTINPRILCPMDILMF